MEGRVCLVTGANSGHGRAVARALALKGATVVLGCRDPNRGEQTRAALTAATGNPRLGVLTVDLASRTSVIRAADRLSDTHGKLDVLVNNAAAWWRERRLSPDGIELVWAVNVIGPWLLTDRLVPALEASGAGRILNVSSTYAGGLDLDDVEFARRPYDGLKAYVASKQAVRMATWWRAERLAGRPVTANALSPGFMHTALGRNAPASFKAMLVLPRPLQASPDKGADTAVWLSSSEEGRALNGAFVVKRQSAPCAFRDPEAVRRLETICADYLAAPGS